MSDAEGWMRQVLGDDAAHEPTGRDASPATHACYMLMLHELLLRNMTNHGVNDIRGQEAVHAEWASWTGMTFHNLPAIALGGDEDEGRAFLTKECRDFVEYAMEHPVPAAWHPSHPESDQGLGRRWQSLCEHAARLADMPVEYGIPATSVTCHLPTLPDAPRLGLVERLLPASLRTFLKEYEKAVSLMPTGSISRHRWTRWKSDETH